MAGDAGPSGRCGVMRRVRFWLMEQKALARNLDHAHRALAIAHRSNQILVRRVADLEATSTCAGRAEHIRLAARCERAEALYEQRVDPTRVVTLSAFPNGAIDG